MRPWAPLLWCRALPGTDTIPSHVSCSEMQARLLCACRQPLPGAVDTTSRGGSPTAPWDPQGGLVGEPCKGS